MSTQTLSSPDPACPSLDGHRIRIHQATGPLLPTVGLSLEVISGQVLPSRPYAHLRVVDAVVNKVDTHAGAEMLDAELVNTADNKPRTGDQVAETMAGNPTTSSTVSESS